MHFADKFQVDAEQPKVWAFVTSPEEFVKIIPDVQNFQPVSDSQFDAAFKVGLGLVKGTMKMRFAFTDLNPPESLRVVGRGSGIQSSADLNIVLNLSAHDGGTEVEWSADLVVGGIAASVGSRLLQSTTEKKIREIIEGIRINVKR